MNRRNKESNSFPKIESKTHILKVRGDNSPMNKLVPRASNCDFCGKPINPWIFSDIYLPLVHQNNTDSISYRVMFGLSCCHECKSIREKINSSKSWAIALTIIGWVALFVGILSLIVKYSQSPELLIIFLVGPVFVISLIFLIKVIVPGYERYYAKKYSAMHPFDVVVRYPLWYQMLNRGWEIHRISKRDTNDNNSGSIGSNVGFSIIDSIFR